MSTAKATRVGGTSISLKVPDMLSFPPMAAVPMAISAWSAPSSADRGAPQRTGSCMGLPKYSWRVKRRRR